MGKHRRYPVKGLGTAKHHRGKQNSRNPSSDAFISSTCDEQPTTRNFRELQAQIAATKSQQQQKNSSAHNKKPKKRNRFLEETAKLGYTQRPWEDEDRLLRRIVRENSELVTNEFMKAQFGTAGRPVSEIAQEYKKMDEQSRLKRLQKIARHERLLKQREKQQVFEKSRVGRKSSCDNDSDLPHDSDTKLNNEELNHELSSSDDDADNKMKFQPASNTSQNTCKAKKYEDRNTRRKERRKRLLEDNRKMLAEERLINAKEEIPFGARIDAPPKFSGMLRKTMEPIYSQAGKKELLLKRLL